MNMMRVKKAIIHWYDNSSNEGLIKININGIKELVYFTAPKQYAFESGQELIVNLYSDYTFVGAMLNHSLTSIYTWSKLLKTKPSTMQQVITEMKQLESIGAL